MTKESDSTRIQLILGILGFIGVLLGVLATVFAPIIQEWLKQNSLPSQTPLAIVASPTQAPVIPTTTVPTAGAPASTPAPATSTPEPTFTLTQVQSLAIGDDWKAGCISSVWSLYPAAAPTAENGCLKTPVDKFYIKDNKLAFAFNNNVPSAEIHGLFAQLPASGSLTLNMHLNEVTTGEILIGIFGAPQIDNTTNGVMLVIPTTNKLDKALFQLKSMPGQKLFSKSQGPVGSTNGLFDMSFKFNSGEVTVNLKSGQVNLGTLPVLSGDKWLFIGYQAFIGSNNLVAEFSNLVIVK